MKIKLEDYKGKYFVLVDETEDSYIIGEITKEEALKEDFVKQHKDNCEYYGIPAYIGKDEELNKVYK